MKYLLVVLVLLSTLLYSGKIITCTQLNVESNIDGEFRNEDNLSSSYEFYVEDTVSIATSSNTSYKLVFTEMYIQEDTDNKYRTYEQRNYNLLYIPEVLSHGIVYVGYEYTLYFNSCRST